MMNPLHLVNRLRVDTFHERRIGRIKRARKHEVVPNEQTQFVAQIVEMLALVDATTPQPQAVHIGRNRGSEITRVTFAREGRDQGMRRNPIGPLDKNRPPIHDKLK